MPYLNRTTSSSRCKFTEDTEDHRRHSRAPFRAAREDFKNRWKSSISLHLANGLTTAYVIPAVSRLGCTGCRSRLAKGPRTSRERQPTRPGTTSPVCGSEEHSALHAGDREKCASRVLPVSPGSLTLLPRIYEHLGIERRRFRGDPARFENASKTRFSLCFNFEPGSRAPSLPPAASHGMAEVFRGVCGRRGRHSNDSRRPESTFQKPCLVGSAAGGADSIWVLG
ncbi:hypothetical protein V8D89_004916 [Ganoderma adspersum]